MATEATEKAPENTAAWFAVGVVQDKLGKLDQVIAAMEKVIALDSKHATALNYLGYTFADRNMRLPEAEKLVQRALKMPFPTTGISSIASRGSTSGAAITGVPRRNSSGR